MVSIVIQVKIPTGSLLCDCQLLWLLTVNTYKIPTKYLQKPTILKKYLQKVAGYSAETKQSQGTKRIDISHLLKS